MTCDKKPSRRETPASQEFLLRKDVCKSGRMVVFRLGSVQCVFRKKKCRGAIIYVSFTLGFGRTGCGPPRVRTIGAIQFHKPKAEHSNRPSLPE